MKDDHSPFQDLFRFFIQPRPYTPVPLDAPLCRGAHYEAEGFGPATWHRCQHGIVYIVKYGDVYKIGNTASRTPQALTNRIGAANRTRGEKGDPVVLLETVCRYGLEFWLHERFKDRRTRSEFFRLTEQDLEWLTAFSEFNEQPVNHLPITPRRARRGQVKNK